MKLDRNINPGGRGKYALIQLRKGKPEPIQSGDPRIIPSDFKVPIDAVHFGGEGGEQFFVMKYKDKFTAPALRAYAAAIRKEIEKLDYVAAGPPVCPVDDREGLKVQAAELAEYADEIEAEAAAAEKFGTRIPD